MNKNTLPTPEQINEMTNTFHQVIEDAEAIQRMTIWLFHGQLQTGMNTLFSNPELVWKRVVKKVKADPAASLRWLAGATVLFLELTEAKKRKPTSFNKAKLADWDREYFMGTLDTAISNLYQLGDKSTLDEDALLIYLNNLKTELEADTSDENFATWQLFVIGSTNNQNEEISSWATAVIYDMGRYDYKGRNREEDAG
jgi:hypothetical protein